MKFLTPNNRLNQLVLLSSFAFGSLLLSGCGEDGATSPDLSAIEFSTPSSMLSSQEWADSGQFYNTEAVIPPQCYTKTDDRFNPCFTCHQSYEFNSRPNNMQDGYLQGEYDFSEVGVHNHWRNLFIDRTEMIKQISDNFILSYINQDNYTELKTRLQKEGFGGYIPDINAYALGSQAFDEYGFAKDNSGWVAFNYKPFPSTFWPTNGSTDDVIIRLPPQFRQDAQGTFQRDVYMANLALLEINIQGLTETTLPSVDENIIGADIDGNGILETTDRIVKQPYYLGLADNIERVPMLYPVGTEFLHSVRYVGTNDNGDIFAAKRMKELRYMKKNQFFTKAALNSAYDNERDEKTEGNLPTYVDNGDKGLNNGMGWQIQGFIEDSDGSLRMQTKEEGYYCMGCHTTIGSTIDQTFAFPRKVTGKAGWKYLDLKGMQDVASVASENPEFLEYMLRVGGGDEFRQNQEMIDKWFNPDGSIKEADVRAADVYELITPSRERALKLNKAYYTIVKQQTYLYGRDANIKAASNVFDEIENHVAPLEEQYRYDWDLRLDWSPETSSASN